MTSVDIREIESSCNRPTGPCPSRSLPRRGVDGQQRRRSASSSSGAHVRDSPAGVGGRGRAAGAAASWEGPDMTATKPPESSTS
jgi:hypothetical protein